MPAQCRHSLYLTRQTEARNTSMHVKLGYSQITSPPCLSLVSERYYWDSKLHIPTADYQEVLRDDKAALAWLLALRQVGVVYLRGAPAEQGQVARLAERIGYLRLTFYG